MQMDQKKNETKEGIESVTLPLISFPTVTRRSPRVELTKIHSLCLLFLFLCR